MGLLLIVLVAAGPAVAVLIDLQRELRRERDTQARTIALQRAELLGASLDNVIEATGRMLVALTLTDQIANLRPDCGLLLDDLRRGAPDYPVAAVVQADGRLVCHSPAGSFLPEAAVALTQPFLAVQGFTLGRTLKLPGLPRPVLTVALPFRSRDGTRAVLVTGLDVARISTVMARLRQPAGGELVVADRDGNVLARASADAVEAPGSLGPLRPFLGGPAGASLVEHPDRKPYVVGHVPSGSNAAGLFVAAGFSIDDLVGGIDAATNRGFVLTILGAGASVLLALFLGQRFLRAPASVLLEAARRWGSGDLTARAKMPSRAASEFAGLGVAFNEMAELLQYQRKELQGLNDALELRVAERTRALLESNNRLQVEIAERELTEASLRQAQKLQAVGQLASGIGHDFNNLLTVILGSLDLLRKRMLGPDPRQSRLFDTAVQAVERGSRLTAQLLTFSRKQPLVAVSVDVAAAIGGMAGLLASTLGGKISLETRVEPDLWPAMLDPNQFEASILNLALNARDAMPSGGRLIIAAANITTTPASVWSELPPGDYVSVSVGDTGAGMSAEIASRAFDPFFTTKPTGEGSGLGLSQVHGMVRQSGGIVSIHSRPSGGTRITMILPRSLTDPLGEDDGADCSSPALGRSEAVLLVDDDEQVLTVTQAVLAEVGYTVITADGGAAALRAMESDGHRIRIMIADYAMPEMTGLELMQAVRRQWPGTALLLATGYADYPDLVSSDLLADQIIHKPFRSNEMLARIHSAVRQQDAVES